MSNVKEINLKQPNESAIRAVEKMLDDLKSGDIRSYLGVVAFHDGGVSLCWGGIDERAPVRTMIGEFEALKVKILGPDVLDVEQLP